MTAEGKLALGVIDAALFANLDKLADEIADLSDAEQVESRMKFETRRIVANEQRRFNRAIRKG